MSCTLCVRSCSGVRVTDMQGMCASRGLPLELEAAWVWPMRA